MSDIRLPDGAVMREVFVNKTRGYSFSESKLPARDVWCAGRDGDVIVIPKKKFFDDLVAEYGRCTGRVYVDAEDGTVPVGWVFESRQKYDDSDDTYLREVWVSFSVEETSVSHVAI